MRDLKNNTRHRGRPRSILAAANYRLSGTVSRSSKTKARARALLVAGLVLTIVWLAFGGEAESEPRVEPVALVAEVPATPADSEPEEAEAKLEVTQGKLEKSAPKESGSTELSDTGVVHSEGLLNPRDGAEGATVSKTARAIRSLRAKKGVLDIQRTKILEKAPEPVQVVAKRAAPVPKIDIKSLAPDVAGTDRDLTKKMHQLFSDYDVPEAGVVVLDIKTGKVLTEVGYRDGQADRAAANQARWPGASIFKIVTASALLRVGVSAQDKWCFDGGFRKLTLRDIKAKSGGTCSTLLTSFARSYNVPFGRWADRRLSAKSLKAEATRLGFGRGSKLGMVQGASSTVDLSLDRLSFAQAAAGFGDIKLSALHGAMLAAVVGSGGVATEPRYSDESKLVRQRLLPIDRAKALQQMMVKTVSSGSARRAFREHGRSAMRDSGAGGKTGSLSAKGRDLSWFVGFAPADNPTVAVGAYVANHPTWRIRATYVGREALRSALFGTSPYRPVEATGQSVSRLD